MSKKSIKVNTILNIVKTISSIVFPLITYPYILRVLLPDNVGKVNFSVTFVGYFALIASLGITAYAIRECSIYRYDKMKFAEVASQIYSVNFYTTVVAYILLGVILLIYGRLEAYRIPIIIYSTTIIFTTLGADWINSAMEDYAYITCRSIMFQVLSLIALFIWVKGPDDYLKYMQISVLSAAGANVSNYFYRRKFGNIRFTTKIDWKKHLPGILLLFSMQMSQQVLNSTDVTMLGLIRGDYETGIYSTAMKIYVMISQVVFSVLWVLLPRLSQYSVTGSIQERNQLLRKALSFMIALGYPCIAGIIMTANDAILLFGGEEYLDAVPVLMILMGEFFIDLIGQGFIGNMIMLPAKKESKFMIACIVAAVVNIIINAICIPRYGVIAAAGATVISRFVMLIVLLFYVDKSVKIEHKVSLFLPPIVGCAVIVVSALLVRLCSFEYWIRFAVTVAVGSVGYIATLMAFKYELVMDIVRAILRRTNKN